MKNEIMIFSNFCSKHSEALLTSTHNKCFRAKIIENVYPCNPKLYYVQVGFNRLFIARICLHDVLVFLIIVHHNMMIRNYSYITGSMTGILELKWETLQKRRKDNRLILLYKGLKR